MNLQEATERFPQDRVMFERLGVIFPHAKGYMPDEFKSDFALAMDAQPAMITDANSAIPAMFTTLVDPEVYEILFAPNQAAKILGENKKGTWIDDTAIFLTVEGSGEVSSYGDYNENGHAAANVNFPQRQAYLFQIIEEYGDREVERAGAAKLNWVSEIQKSSATVSAKYLNLTYFFGVAGLQNYGLLNDPNLPAALTPAPKAYGGNAWVVGNVVVASANEIYNDIQSLYMALVTQSAGLIDEKTPVVLAMSPGSSIALTATNSFNVNVRALLKDNFPNIRIETAVQYGALSAANPQGNLAGNLVQMIAESLEGQQAGYAAFNEKQRSHNMVKALSSMKQKKTSGTWGTIIRMPVCFAQMVGV